MTPWWLGLAALAEPPSPQDALNPVLATLYVEARADEAAGRYREAANGYAVVLRGDPWFDNAVLDLGRVLERSDRYDEAIEVYAKRPDDPDATEARARLLLDLGDFDRARALIRDLRQLRPNRPDWRLLDARARARTDPVAASNRLEDYLAFYGTSVDDPGFEIAWSVTLEALRREGEHAVARQRLDGWIARFPKAEHTEGLTRARRDLDIDRAARALAASGSDALSSDQIHQLTTARRAFAERDYPRAAALLEELLQASPRSAVAWATLSDVRAAQGALTASVEAIDAAIELAPLDADLQVRRGDRLLEGFGGRLDPQALEAYRRAVERRPTDAAIWLAKASAERRTGHWQQALASYREVLRLEPHGPLADKAHRAIEGAVRPLPSPPEQLPARGRPPGVPEAAWSAYFRAWAWREYRPSDAESMALEEAEERAWNEVKQARALAPRFTPAMNLEATLLADRGSIDEAIALIRASLAIDATQRETWFTLAQVLEDENDPEAVTAYAKAAELGHPEALWRRAEAQTDARQWWAARETLGTYFAATTHGPRYEAARQLDAALDRRVRLLTGLGGLGLGFSFLTPLFLRWWRRSGVGLQGLAEQVPRETAAIARLLSAIRHEVLKHHTSVLPSVAKALDQGDDGPASWVADRLYGSDGALARLDRYLAELAVIGRRHDTRLNLRYRDADLGRLIDATRRLRRLESSLRRPRDPARLADRLRAIVSDLHDHVYPALGRRIARLSTRRLQAAAIERVVAEVVAEPAFVGIEGLAGTVEWPTEPVYVQVDPGDLADVLGNLVRNAFAASSTLEDFEHRRILLRGTIESDPITGLEQIAIAVADHHPAPLTTAMVRGRYIARGLGLAVDLTSRAGGAITVEPCDGYAKAVVVRLPSVESPEEFP
ncbi:MAG: tetratricopeptide repeat protein [Myxococcota bacterium]